MSTARVVADYRQPDIEVDENTVLTDHWLSFFSARQQDEKNLSDGRHREVEPGLDDFCRRVNSLSAGGATLVNDPDRIRQDGADMEFASNPPELDEARPKTTAALKGQLPASGMSFFRRVRSSALFATIQKLF